MTLAQLADYICTKARQSDATALAIAKNFLKQRHEMLWHEALWKDSLVQFTQTLDPDVAYTVTDTWLPTKGVLLCPTIIDRVLAARTDAKKLNVQRQEYYFRIDYDSFSRSGQATEFVLLPPCVWEWETAQSLYGVRYAVGDAGISLATDLADSDGVGISRVTTAMATSAEAIGSTERVDALSKPATTGNVALATIAAVSTAGIGYVPGFPGGATLPVTAGAVYEIEPGVNEGGNTLVNGTESIAMTTGTSLVVTAQGATLVFQGSPTVGTALNATVNQLSALVTVPAAALAAKKRQRIRFMEIPTARTTVRILGKRVCPTFTADNDEPAISGVSNCLLAFALADMLQWLRQYGKAQAVQQEGVALLDQLKTLETVQQAHNISIQPGQSYVSEWQFNSGAYSPLTF